VSGESCSNTRRDRGQIDLSVNSNRLHTFQCGCALP